jgi:hypothetical protein
MSDNLPTFATNDSAKGVTVAASVNELFAFFRTKLRDEPNISIATAYINPAGFNLLADELEKAPYVRLLIGAEPEESLVQSRYRNDKGADILVFDASRNHENWLKMERNLTGFSRDAIQQAERMVAWLRDINSEGKSRVEVRRFTDGFLHGKAYISSSPGMEGVLAGSSNFTYAGLMLNAELNLGYPAGDQQHGKKVVNWFEEYWNRSQPYDLASLYDAIWLPHSPWHVFLRMLSELYGAELEDERPIASTFELAAFQIDGISRIKRLLKTNGGVIVADEVGLGKTFLAASVIQEATDVNRQRVLIVCPSAIKSSMWEPFLRKYGFRLTDVMSYTEIRMKMDPEHPLHNSFVNQIRDYALVVIDEAHNLRNSGADQSKAVDRVILEGKHPKQVVLLTATPVNNSLNDLDTLLKYFIRDDARFANLDIPSIRGYIRAAQDMDPENLTPDHLFQLMDQVAVRRTRKFVKEQYPNELITNSRGEKVPIQFPAPKVRRIDYDLSEHGDMLVNAVLAALSIGEDEDLYSAYESAKKDPGRLMLARYTPSRYLRGSNSVERIQIQNAGLLRSALLKRLESSASAISATLEMLIISHERFLQGARAGYVLEGEALREWISSESDDIEEALADLDDKALQKAKSLGEYFSEALLADTESDLELLRKLLKLAQDAVSSPDPKFDALAQSLKQIADESRRPNVSGASSGDRRKVVIFSTYTDTVIDISERLKMLLHSKPKNSLIDYVNRVAEPQFGAYKSVHKAGKSGGVDQGGRAHVIESFAPKTASRINDDGEPTGEDLFDILITTDVLAEGVNLQQAGQVINYDLPWNPMKIVQRHGRVDRLFSEHEEVHLGLFFPAAHLDEMLKLQETLERKLNQAEAAIGAANVLPGRSGVSDVVFNDLAEVEKVFEDLLDKGSGGSSISGEELRRRLYRQFSEHPAIKQEALELPFGSGSGFINKHARANGYVFCVKIADHPDPWFRFVQVDDDWKTSDKLINHGVFSEQLLCLQMADPKSSTETRSLTDEAYSGVFDAWGLARDSIFHAWKRNTDPNNLQAEPPLSFLDAANFILQKGASIGVDDQTRTLARLRSVPSRRVSNAMRRVLNGDVSDAEKVVNILQLLDREGVQEAPEPRPLRDINISEVRLVTWMAVAKGSNLL